MIVKDMMPSFELFRPEKIEDALALTAKYGKDGWKLGGGYDSLGWFKERIKRPKAVIDLSGIAALHGIKETADGIEIGALTTLTEIEEHAAVKAKFRILSEAAGQVASPQIRHAGTIGGNLSQDARCTYYRYGLPCYRAGGNACYADTPEGQNREHALFDADRCVAVTPSDVAVALVALEGSVVIRGPKGERVVAAQDFFIGPKVDITRMTVTQPEEIVTAIRVPNTWAGSNFYFEKVTDRESWDFALINVAASLVVKNGTIERARVVCGGVSCTPKRLEAVEAIIKGKPVGADIATVAGKSASRGAKTLNYNHFKIPMMEKLVMRAVRDAVA